VQTQIFFAASGIDSGIGFGVYKKIPALLGMQGKILLLIFITYYTVQTMFSFFGTGRYKNISMSRLMFEPYVRIFVQQFIVILGSMLLTFGWGDGFILVVVVIKLLADIYINTDRMFTYVEKKEREQKEQRDNIGRL
jgi:hypothetical protein